MIPSERVYLVDHVVPDDPSSHRAMNERVALCYAWADAHGVQVLDEILYRDRGTDDVIRFLGEVVAMCARDRAGLLVHPAAAFPLPFPPPDLGFRRQPLLIPCS